METKEKIYNILINSNDYVSGEYLAEELKISRTAVWKGISSLKKDGCEILSKTNKGYLIKDGNILSVSEIKGHITTPIKEIRVFKDITSTNDYLKQESVKNQDISLVVADTQTAGKGRLNRKFYSPSGSGIYMSVLVSPKLLIKDSIKITTYTAVAVAKVIERLSGKSVGIKWVNDLFLGGKKIAGILTEAVCDCEIGELKYAIIGIGINVRKVKFPNELKDIATTIESESGVKLNRNLLIAEIYNELLKNINEITSGEFMKEYKEKSIVLGKDVLVMSGEEKFYATAIDIDNSGAIVLKKGCETITLNVGDVSLRI